MKSFLLIALVLLSFSTYADSGIFYSEGGNLFPVQETSISMQKEILRFTYTPEGLVVDVFFEFNNPGETRTEIVGFVVPPCMTYEDIDFNFDVEKEMRHPYVYDFIAAQNGSILPYKVTKYESRGFSTTIDGVEERDVIYYFNVTFEPGVTKLYNHYVFKGSKYRNEDFLYRLKTGKMWANQTIEDFTMIIDASGQWFELPATLSKSIAAMAYEINGVGKISEIQGDPNKIHAYLTCGYLSLHCTNLKPDYDINLSFKSLSSKYYDFSEIYTNDFNIELPSLHWIIGSDDAKRYEGEFEGITLEAIQDMINFVYSIHGYTFGGKDFYHYFEKFSWYIPNPQLSENDIKFTVEEQAFLTALINERAKRN
ncbi:MAG: hypothetical protein C0592_12575 [Marinilabiliales bacterium]|nr:MAG: hypothetical protein C0592_12575 [Marinilabiliales bacterium]